jgi:hypothetical protein
MYELASPKANGLAHWRGRGLDSHEVGSRLGVKLVDRADSRLSFAYRIVSLLSLQRDNFQNSKVLSVST